MSGNHDQYRFGDDGELEEPDNDDRGDEEQMNDLGEEMPWYETKAGFRRDVMSSLFQKAVRRSDDETAAFAAWELVRSGEGRDTRRTTGTAPFSPVLRTWWRATRRPNTSSDTRTSPRTDTRR